MPHTCSATWKDDGVLTHPVVNVFFFSSRRRHTRFDCDWSSDVCSSDLQEGDSIGGELGRFVDENPKPDVNDLHARITWGDGSIDQATLSADPNGGFDVKIGRASCRERG